ncbi:hypothetical protein R7F07_24090 [Vibrio sp. YT-16]|uniref:hypothetical protein n=1 Tax=Vibrio TaxID=662 RepID=UPI00148E1CB8|nr:MULTISPECIES: hypothetical protein [Vibrio]MCS0265640.1 hypothetical protein [Vibrio alginolyticus]MDW1465579.1 hypothetical protein [Vibrio sp. YT-16]NOH90867.1 hypothetical protein [Vibrio alginolyticus]
MKKLILLAGIALSGCTLNQELGVLSMATDSMEDREKTRFVAVHYGVLLKCDPDYEHLSDLATRFKELSEVAPQTAWALKSVTGDLPPAKSNPFIDCDKAKKNVEHWIDTKEYYYHGQGQWVVYKDE